MRPSRAAPLLLLLGLFSTTGESLFPHEDLEGSGLDLEISGSGAGSDEDLADDNKGVNSRAFAGGGNNNHHAPPDLNIFKPPAGESGFVILGTSKSVFQNQEVIGGIIAGGVTGLILAVAITALLIYRWHKRIEEKYIQAKQSDF